ncbi:aminoglycoside phosphotransferase [Amycolatopsis balhimycina DSM 5908]|uniref:Aminoglycoside phosphotransferase n=1 Tax=Amycolatopsis balhimycina DSM 5908 TaxID=1081091 RepID=A0A428W2X4_AMYBA|nr:aminoglycoside phosphotransferase family protein [Amycolatopsis balhimycina]RSM37421.1 aminoglycoside phosphotransferase [Amycolatopsis balhimycina DSM 5908]
MVNDLRVPPLFAARAPRVLGAEAVPWLAALPGLAAEYAREWGLTFEGEAMHGYVGVAQPARRADGTPVVLKLGRRDEESADEPLALSTWAGQGAVLLLESAPDDGVLLLERLDAGRTLDDLPLSSAIPLIGDLARRLAVPAPPALTRNLRAEAARLIEELPRRWAELGEPFDRRHVDDAVAICRELGPSAGAELVNEDLHFENVLGGTREPWLVIDPKPLSGDLEWGVIPLFWNRFTESTLDERMALIVASQGLDAAKARAWTLVRAVQNWIWMLEEYEETGEDSDDPAYVTVPEIAVWAASR